MHVPQELVDSYRRGDPGAFDEIVRSTHRQVYSLVYRILGNPEDAADATQEVYLRVWRGLKSFRGDANLSTWLYRIAANTALSTMKRRARGGIVTDPVELPERAGPDATEGTADAVVLEEAMKTLPASQRAAVVLKDVYGWSCAEIAREMGTTEGAVKVRLFRARQRLADHLGAGDVVVPMKKRKRATS